MYPPCDHRMLGTIQTLLCRCEDCWNELFKDAKMSTRPCPACRRELSKEEYKDKPQDEIECDRELVFREKLAQMYVAPMNPAATTSAERTSRVLLTTISILKRSSASSRPIWPATAGRTSSIATNQNTRTKSPNMRPTLYVALSSNRIGRQEDPHVYSQYNRGGYVTGQRGHHRQDEGH
jgi:hypothetical protein